MDHPSIASMWSDMTSNTNYTPSPLPSLSSAGGKEQRKPANKIVAGTTPSDLLLHLISCGLERRLTSLRLERHPFEENQNNQTGAKW